MALPWVASSLPLVGAETLRLIAAHSVCPSGRVAKRRARSKIGSPCEPANPPHAPPHCKGPVPWLRQWRSEPRLDEGSGKVKPAATSAKSDAPARGNSLSAHGNAMGKWFQKKRPVRALQPPGPFQMVASSWGAPCRAFGFITDQTHGVAMGCEWTAPSGRKRSDYSAFFRKPAALPWATSSLPLRGGNAPIIVKGWHHPVGESKRRHFRDASPFLTVIYISSIKLPLPYLGL